MPQLVRLQRLGLIPYHDAWDWQRRTADAVREGALEALALVQHPHVYTFGRRVHPENLLAPTADAEVIASDRGGDITYHGPGQLVAYPIISLHRRNLGAADYVRLLEEVMIRTAATFHVDAHRIAGRPGVWTATPIASHRAVARGEATSAQPPDTRKRFEALPKIGAIGHALDSASSSTVPFLASPPFAEWKGRGTRGSEGEVAKLGAIGVRVQRGVTSHGLALNVDPDLTRFDAIVPCGLTGSAVTSLAHQLGHPVNIDDAEHALIAAFEAVFKCQFEPAPTQSTQPIGPKQPLSVDGEGRALAVRGAEGAAGVRFNPPSPSNPTDGHPPHCEPSRQRGAAIRGGAAPQLLQPAHRQPQPLSSQARPSRSGRGEGRALAVRGAKGAAWGRFDAPNYPSASRGSGGAAHARGLWGVSPQGSLLEGRSRQGLRPQDAQSRTAVRLGR